MGQLACPVDRLERIVIAADDCEFCEGAIREGINLARACRSRVTAVGVTEVNPEYASLAPKAVEDLQSSTRAFLESVRMRAFKAGVACEAVAREGEEAADCIVEEARERQAGMVVMGRRGRKGLKRLLMGSVTARVIGHAPCSVLVVPRAARLDQIKTILVATDGSGPGRAAAEEAVSIAVRNGSRIVAVSVESGDVRARESAAEAASLAQKGGVQAEPVVLSGRPYEAIVAAAKERDADLIVVGRHGRTGLRKLLMGSVAERVVGLAHCPTLVVKS